MDRKQLDVIKRLTTNITIIPDSDEIKKGKGFGAGFMSAIRNRKMAMAAGFHVTIQEIPSSIGKNDPDSYITSIDILESLDKKDFVLWYAEKLFANAATDVVKRAKAIHNVVDIVKSTNDTVS